MFSRKRRRKMLVRDIVRAAKLQTDITFDASATPTPSPRPDPSARPWNWSPHEPLKVFPTLAIFPRKRY